MQNDPDDGNSKVDCRLVEQQLNEWPKVWTILNYSVDELSRPTGTTTEINVIVLNNLWTKINDFE